MAIESMPWIPEEVVTAFKGIYKFAGRHLSDRTKRGERGVLTTQSLRFRMMLIAFFDGWKERAKTDNRTKGT